MTMEATNTPAKPALFSSLVAHEITQATSSERGESNQGLRPRLLTVYEMFDQNRDTPQSFEEQAEIQESPHSMQPGIGKPESAASWLQPPVSPYRQEHLSQPENMPKSREFGQFSVPEFSHDKQQGDNQIPDEQPLAVRILGVSAAQKASNSTISNELQPEPMQQRRKQVSLPERILVERTHNFERETIHEIRPSGLFGHISDRSAGVTPKQIPVQNPIPKMEKAPEPTIEIHIGRIEVRAQVQATPAKLEQTPTPSADNRSLQAYLFNRSRGGRS
jgi:hypothetical protein